MAKTCLIFFNLFPSQHLSFGYNSLICHQNRAILISLKSLQKFSMTCIFTYVYIFIMQNMNYQLYNSFFFVVTHSFGVKIEKFWYWWKAYIIIYNFYADNFQRLLLDRLLILYIHFFTVRSINYRPFYNFLVITHLSDVKIERNWQLWKGCKSF